jgi:hypothetical protein
MERRIGERTGSEDEIMVLILYKLISDIFILNRIREKGKAKVEISILPCGSKSNMYRIKKETIRLQGLMTRGHHHHHPVSFYSLGRSG